MRANKKDANHNEIESYFRSLGFVTLDIHDLKKCCDIVVSKANFTAMIEIKDGSKPPSQRRLTEGEIEFRDYWITQGVWFEVKRKEEVDYINYLAEINQLSDEQLKPVYDHLAKKYGE
jgi:negative regulator of genetic competence, sporulation and motility